MPQYLFPPKRLKPKGANESFLLLPVPGNENPKTCIGGT